MTEPSYECSQCGRELSYKTTKHNGCQGCGFVPPHSAD